jgi:hypothetical protein
VKGIDQTKNSLYCNKLANGVISVTDGTGQAQLLLWSGIAMDAISYGRRPRTAKQGEAWILLCLALAIHVLDEALTGFLKVYNPTVLALRQRLGYWPMPPFEFRNWLTGLIVLVVILLALSPFAFRGARAFRPFFYLFAILMLANGLGHIAATILGQTVSSVHFARPAPGFYSAPLLLAGSIYSLLQLRKTRVSREGTR